jgi:Do/DeqQ family serine protease
MKSKRVYGVFALVIVGLVFGALLVSGFGLIRPSMANVTLGAPTAPVNLNADANSFNEAFIQVAKKVTPEIVLINVVAKTKGQDENPFFFQFFNNIPKEEKGSGSGIIISPDGYILTNNHVVENATSVSVGLSDGRTFEAKVVGTDPLTDIAVIKINAKNLPAAYLGNSDSIQVGQWVMAIGNPLALTSTVTAGIVSALHRGHLGLISSQYGVENYIQTDAAINPGNSGGALVDLSGAVIGINAAIAASSGGTYIGYGFAVPINLAKNVAKDLIAHGKVTRGYIGVEISDVDDAVAKSLGLDKPEGVLVQKIVPDGAASKTDIKSGDVILKVDGQPVNKPNELQSLIFSKRAGETVHLTIFRDGKTIERDVTLQERKNEGNNENTSNNNNNEQNNNQQNLSSANLDNVGLTVKNMSPDELDKYNIKNGILITDVKDYGTAQDAGLFKGLVIVETDRKEIKDVSQFKDIVDGKEGSAVLLKVVDDKGNSRLVGLEVPNNK